MVGWRVMVLIVVMVPIGRVSDDAGGGCGDAGGSRG